MKIRTITNASELATLAKTWNGLSGGVPFRSFAWLSTWWRCFGEVESGQDESPSSTPAPRGPAAELAVAAVHDPSTFEVIAIAPWYIEHSRTQGRVMRWLGSGVVCSDYVSVLCEEDREQEVAVALADWLASDEAPRWDALELSGVATEDKLLLRLIVELSGNHHKAHAHHRPGATCWRLTLPESWDDYLKLLSKTRRKRTRGIVRDWFDSGRAELLTMRRGTDLSKWLATFEDLHQRRRQSLGQPGCFADPQFASFLREVARQLFETGQFQFNQLRIDGQPVAMDFNLLGNRVVYAYQGGVDPTALDDQPGHLITIAQLRRALNRGLVAYDFLRGDEPYKHNWRATPCELTDYRIVPARAGARVAHAVWVTGQWSRDLARGALRTATGLRDQALAAMKGLARPMNAS